MKMKSNQIWFDYKRIYFNNAESENGMPYVLGKQGKDNPQSEIYRGWIWGFWEMKLKV